MQAQAKKVLVVVSSTRPTRIGRSIGDWVVAELAERNDGYESGVGDLAEMGLPLLDEPNHPSQRAYTHDHTKRWSRLVDTSDAFIVALPEYNHGMPASLKNALDYLLIEWQHKPVGFVSYSGGISGGTRAVVMTNSVVTAMGMLPIPNMVNIPRISDHVTEGTFTPSDSARRALATMADRLPAYLEASDRLRLTTV